MAGRFVYWMNVSLDLFIEREAGEHGDIEGPSWIRLGEPLHREFSARARAMSVMVQGRTVYEMMDPFWPNARTDESLPGFLREYGEIPVVLGAGRPLFDALDQPLELDLLEQRSFDQGVTMHRYAVRGAR
jgi:dihydrofolate reductase